MDLKRSRYDVKHAKIKLFKSKKPGPIRLVDDYRQTHLSMFGGCGRVARLMINDGYLKSSLKSSKVDPVFLEARQYFSVLEHFIGLLRASPVLEQMKCSKLSSKLQNYPLITC